MKKALALLLVSLFLWGHSAEGANTWYNAYTGGSWNNPGSALIDTMIYNRMMTEAALKKTQRTPPPQPGASSRARVLYSSSRSPSPVPERAAAAFSNEGVSQRELVAFFNEALRSYEDFSKQAGYPRDLGYAFAFFIGVCVGISTENEVDDAAILAAADQMNRLLLEQPGVASASDAKKRELAETLACMATFALAGYTQSEEAGDQAAAETFVQFARQAMLEMLGVNTIKLRMDARGVRFVE